MHYTMGYFNGHIIDDEGNRIEISNLQSEVELANMKW